MFKFNHITRRSQFEEYSSDKNISSSQIAIYNEDDLSNLLFVGSAHPDHHLIVNKVEQDEPATPVESPLVTDTSGHTSDADDESAILSDLEDESDLEIPPSPSRRRGGTMSISDDDFEFPVFLGKQDEVKQLHPAPLRPALRRSPPVSAQSLHKETSRHVQIEAPEHHVSSIEGPLMAWWPTPIEGMEYAWEEYKTTATVPREQHVAEVDGPCMSWWPAPTDMLQHEWNERFYE